MERKTYYFVNPVTLLVEEIELPGVIFNKAVRFSTLGTATPGRENEIVVLHDTRKSAEDVAQMRRKHVTGWKVGEYCYWVADVSVGDSQREKKVLGFQVTDVNPIDHDLGLDTTTARVHFLDAHHNIEEARALLPAWSVNIQTLTVKQLDNMTFGQWLEWRRDNPFIKETRECFKTKEEANRWAANRRKLNQMGLFVGTLVWLVKECYRDEGRKVIDLVRFEIKDIDVMKMQVDPGPAVGAWIPADLCFRTKEKASPYVHSWYANSDLEHIYQSDTVLVGDVGNDNLPHGNGPSKFPPDRLQHLRRCKGRYFVTEKLAQEWRERQRTLRQIGWNIGDTAWYIREGKVESFVVHTIDCVQMELGNIGAPLLPISRAYHSQNEAERAISAPPVEEPIGWDIEFKTTPRAIVQSIGDACYEFRVNEVPDDMRKGPNIISDIEQDVLRRLGIDLDRLCRNTGVSEKKNQPSEPDQDFCFHDHSPLPPIPTSHQVQLNRIRQGGQIFEERLAKDLPKSCPDCNRTMAVKVTPRVPLNQVFDGPFVETIIGAVTWEIQWLCYACGTIVDGVAPSTEAGPDEIYEVRRRKMPTDPMPEILTLATSSKTTWTEPTRKSIRTVWVWEDGHPVGYQVFSNHFYRSLGAEGEYCTTTCGKNFAPDQWWTTKQACEKAHSANWPQVGDRVWLWATLSQSVMQGKVTHIVGPDEYGVDAEGLYTKASGTFHRNQLHHSKVDCLEAQIKIERQPKTNQG